MREISISQTKVKSSKQQQQKATRNKISQKKKQTNKQNKNELFLCIANIT